MNPHAVRHLTSLNKHLHGRKIENNPDPDLWSMIALRLITPQPSQMWFIPFFSMQAFSSPPPANLFRHFPASWMPTGLSDQAKLPKRPLIVYRAEADERQPGGGGGGGGGEGDES